jgi:hypothetical protein
LMQPMQRLLAYPLIYETYHPLFIISLVAFESSHFGA